MKRGALVFAIVALFLLADGSYLQVSNNQVGGDTGVLFGNPHFFLSAGTVVLISGGLLLVGAVIMWLLAGRRERRMGTGRSAGHPAASGLPARAASGSGPAGKEPGDQR